MLKSTFKAPNLFKKVTNTNKNINDKKINIKNIRLLPTSHNSIQLLYEYVYILFIQKYHKSSIYLEK